eukprot:GEMP01064682.1.p1 GENE.GEMP01064682.1~~GEMP01064682.1.p1  ORF type:complete len:180 (+),score=28.74 GEMP01064682.1:231-770(+)
MQLLPTIALLWSTLSTHVQSSAFLRSRRNQGEAAQDAGEETQYCSCANCQGERLMEDIPPEGFKGFQCKPNADGITLNTCAQPGAAPVWVVQTAQVIAYERYCHFSCKPNIPETITKIVLCAELSKAELKRAQSMDGNGEAFIWHANPMQDSLTVVYTFKLLGSQSLLGTCWQGRNKNK